ncbi:dienelactone hydrolase family protein [soil metagenome]
MRLTPFLITAAFMLFTAASALHAAIKTETISYTSGGKTYKGTLAYDDAAGTAKRPGVLVCHEWWGVNDFARERAARLAEAGYVAFALDMYGDGKNTTDPKEAGKMAGALTSDTPNLRAIAAAGLKVLAERPEVNAEKLGAIGFCMGGTVALELARSGADLDAVVTFHASTLTAKTPADNAAIKARILICDGGADPLVQPEERPKFYKQMNDANLDWQFISYGEAQHAFTNKDADKARIDGVKFNARAEKRSWQAMMTVFDETLKSK